MARLYPSSTASTGLTSGNLVRSNPRRQRPLAATIRGSRRALRCGGRHGRRTMPSCYRGHIVGQKPPLKPREVWSIRTRLQVSGAERDLALFNLAIDSKLRGWELVAVTVGDIALSGSVRDRAVIVQRKTGRPVQFEITEQTRAAVGAWIARRHLTESEFLFPSRVRVKPHMSTRQYGRIVEKWVSSIGLEPKRHGRIQ